MTRFSLRCLALVALFGLSPSWVFASKVPTHGTLVVHDDAGTFSAEAVAKAKKDFEAVEFKHRATVVVKTAKDVPTSRKADFEAVKGDKDKFNRFMSEWSEELARNDPAKPAIYALVLVNEKGSFRIHVHTNRESSVHGDFNNQKADIAAGKLGEGFNRVLKQNLSGDAAKKERDGALAVLTAYTADQLKDVTVPSGSSRTSEGTTAHGGGEKGGSGIMGYICIGLCVLLGAWLVIGLIRAFTGGGGGGGMGGGGFGGGGGGFLSSMLGGMFGAAAGMYMYDQFFGGHSHSGSDLGATGSNDYGASNNDTGADDYGGGSSGNAGGGDWGDSGGGGADYGGGGDWGGGGDAGGGDFGGGDW